MLVSCMLRFLFLTVGASCFNLDTNHTIIYKDPYSKETRSSYFGYSLLLYSGSNGSSPWIQIGAPRANDTEYTEAIEPGVIYRCPIAQQCKKVILDETRSGSRNSVLVNDVQEYYIDKKDGAWIGGAMDIDERSERIVVCGHRWRNSRKELLFDYILGVCYGSRVDQDINTAKGVSKLLPLQNKDKFFHSKGSNKYYLLNYGCGQAGFSVHFPKTEFEQQLLIGAPGVSNWKGSTVTYKSYAEHRKRKYIDPDVLESTYIEGITLYGLLGYQVNSGRFYKNKNLLFYVAGNPKGADTKGKVYIYTYIDQYDVRVHKTLNGYQTGEYFGSSLAVADVNCDGTDDLIVGAPQHTKHFDEGRIYVFISNLEKTVFNKPIIIEDCKTPGARFGSSVVSLGDLDNDGCADIAVGAPYDNSNRGTVYIYSGDPTGPTLSQVISAKDIDRDLRGFGVSISRAADIDDNKYPDVAVGAFLSEQVVLFRAQPVVTLWTSITSVSELKKDAERFNVTVCLRYTGNHAPQKLTVTGILLVDENLGRAHFSGGKNSFGEIVVLIKDSYFYKNITVFLQKYALEEDTSYPISVKVTQRLYDEGGSRTTILVGEDSSSSVDGFKKEKAIMNNKTSISSAQINVPFAIECKDRNKCDAELVLNCSFSGVTDQGYVIGSSSRLTLDISLVNYGEPAFMTAVNISIPTPIRLSSGHKSCFEKKSNSANTSLLYCNLGNPLRNGTLKNLTLNLDTTGVKADSKSVTFDISARTSSVDKNEVFNAKQLQLNFIFDANMIISGKSEELVYSYSKSNRTVFKHTYDVQKKGSSPVEVAEVVIDIPVRFHGIYNDLIFLVLYSPVAYLNAEQPLSCNPDQNYTYYFEENTNTGENLNLESNNNRRKREVESNELQVNQTLFLNCSSSQVRCLRMKCYAGPFDTSSQTSASIELKMILNVSSLDSVLDVADTLYLSTNASVIMNTYQSENITADERFSVINTTFVNTTYTELPSKKVSTWIIALAIIAGILLLMFVTLGLMKAGFFERKKKEELKSLMAIYAENVFASGPARMKLQEPDEDDDEEEEVVESEVKTRHEDDGVQL